LDFFNLTTTFDSVITTSLSVSVLVGSKVYQDGLVNSETRKKPQKAKQKADLYIAQS